MFEYLFLLREEKSFRWTWNEHSAALLYQARCDLQTEQNCCLLATSCLRQHTVCLAFNLLNKQLLLHTGHSYVTEYMQHTWNHRLLLCSHWTRFMLPIYINEEEFCCSKFVQKCFHKSAVCGRSYCQVFGLISTLLNTQVMRKGKVYLFL